MNETILKGKYTIRFKIRSGERSESYRIRDVEGKNYFCKLIDTRRTNPSDYTSTGELRELLLLRSLENNSIAKYIESGFLIRKRIRFAYLICEFVSGESLDRLLYRDGTIGTFDLIQVSLDILRALAYLHGLPTPVYHNAIEPDNIMLDLSTGSMRGVLCGFRYASQDGQDSLTLKHNPDMPMYASDALLDKKPNSKGDLFSLGVVIFKALFSVFPWSEDLLRMENDLPIKQILLDVREKPLGIPNLNFNNIPVSDGLVNIIKRALSSHEDKFDSAEEFSHSLIEEKKRILKKFNERVFGKPGIMSKQDTAGGGFADVAGMQHIKDELRSVMQILNDQEGARQYGISIPNGILLYGPPGCGKTFIAEKFAEETNYNYIFIRASDLASIYIHGSQQKIGALFKEAREKKPSTICFDEIDALVHNREDINNASMSGEVNEFLSQLNNCGKDGVLVIGTTNRPNLIDPAVLRKGRIDKIIYVPPPDLEARTGLFRLLLEKKPVEHDIDYNELAERTEGRVCSDIDYIVSEAARIAYSNKNKISMETLNGIISTTRSSLTAEQAEYYEKVKNTYEGSQTSQKSSIGFRF